MGQRRRHKVRLEIVGSPVEFVEQAGKGCDERKGAAKRSREGARSEATSGRLLVMAPDSPPPSLPSLHVNSHLLGLYASGSSRSKDPP